MRYSAPSGWWPKSTADPPARPAPPQAISTLRRASSCPKEKTMVLMGVVRLPTAGPRLVCGVAR